MLHHIVVAHCENSSRTQYFFLLMEFELWLVCHLTVSSILNIHTFSPKAGDNLATNVCELHPYTCPTKDGMISIPL